MRKLSGRELIFSLASLLVCAIVIRTVYATFIRPRAEAILAEPIAASAAGTRAAQRHLRSVFVILKDHEQEMALILAAWSLSLLALQGHAVARNRRLLSKRYVDVDEQRVVLPEDAKAHGRPIEALPPEERHMFLPRTLMLALNRFGSTRSVQDVAETVRDECELELSRLETQLATIRFAAWAIPAIGFVGTVRGIGAALQEAQGAMQGDISGVTLGLGITFNSTLIALILAILVMFCLHQLQQAQDRLVLDTRTYIDRALIRHMRMM
jgi:biopolymer transport protein ExbB/TolQ